MEVKIVYVEFGPGHAPLAWREGRLLDPEDRDALADAHGRLNRMVADRRRVRTFPGGRAARFGRGSGLGQASLLVEHSLPVEFEDMRLTMTVALLGPGRPDDWATTAAEEISQVLGLRGIDATRDWIEAVLLGSWRLCRPGVPGFLRRWIRWPPGTHRPLALPTSDPTRIP